MLISALNHNYAVLYFTFTTIELPNLELLELFYNWQSFTYLSAIVIHKKISLGKIVGFYNTLWNSSYIYQQCLEAFAKLQRISNDLLAMDTHASLDLASPLAQCNKLLL